MLIGHYNVNSFRNKFYEMSPVFTDIDIDILGISETKLDESFPHEQFRIEEYRCHRRDRTDRGGGIIVYIKSDIPQRRRFDLEMKLKDGIELIAIEIIVRKEKWLFLNIYKPPKVNNALLIDTIAAVMSITEGSISSTFIVGDININMLQCPPDFSNFLRVYGMSNIIDSYT